MTDPVSDAFDVDAAFVAILEETKAPTSGDWDLVDVQDETTRAERIAAHVTSLSAWLVGARQRLEQLTQFEDLLAQIKADVQATALERDNYQASVGNIAAAFGQHLDLIHAPIQRALARIDREYVVRVVESAQRTNTQYPTIDIGVLVALLQATEPPAGSPPVLEFDEILEAMQAVNDEFVEAVAPRVHSACADVIRGKPPQEQDIETMEAIARSPVMLASVVARATQHGVALPITPHSEPAQGSNDG